MNRVTEINASVSLTATRYIREHGGFSLSFENEDTLYGFSSEFIAKLLNWGKPATSEAITENMYKATISEFNKGLENNKKAKSVMLGDNDADLIKTVTIENVYLKGELIADEITINDIETVTRLYHIARHQYSRHYQTYIYFQLSKEIHVDCSITGDVLFI